MRWRKELGQWYRTRRFRRFFRKLLDDPVGSRNTDLLRDLIEAWGNKAWSALEEYLEPVIAGAWEAQGPILECGSGLTTLILGAIAQRRRDTLDIWSLEHKPKWSVRVQQELDRWGFGTVRLCVAPLADYGAYEWYAPPLRAMPNDFAMVVCDGPPSSVKGGRYGLLPVMRDRLVPGCVILLDDAGRHEEVDVARKWEEELGSSLKIYGTEKPYIEVRVP